MKRVGDRFGEGELSATFSAFVPSTQALVFTAEKWEAEMLRRAQLLVPETWRRLERIRYEATAWKRKQRLRFAYSFGYHRMLVVARKEWKPAREATWRLLWPLHKVRCCISCRHPRNTFHLQKLNGLRS
jgi:hypothetical protein